MLTIFFLSGWQFLDFIGWHIAEHDISHFFSHATAIFWIPATLALLNSVYELLDKPKDLLIKNLSVIAGLSVLLGLFTNLVIDDVIIEQWGYRPTIGFLYLPVVFVCSVIPGASILILLFKSCIGDKDLARRKVSLLLLVLVSIGLTAILVFNVLLSNILNIHWIPQAGSTLSIFLSAALFIAIGRYNFLNIDVKNSAKTVFSQLDEGVILLDTKGVIVEVNEYLLAKFKVTRKEVIGKAIDDLSLSKYSFLMNFSGEEMTFDIGNEKFVFLVTQKNMYQGEINTGKIIIFSDVTRLKENEKEIDDLNSRLKERVNIKTKELNNAERTIIENEYKQELAELTSMTLHNVKNLLNSLKISAERSTDVLTGTGVEGLGMANNLLRENFDTLETFIHEEKGKKLMEYFLVVEENLKEEIDDSRKEVDLLMEKVRAIESIIFAQQGYSGVSEFEYLYIEQVIDDVIIMQENSIFQNQVEIVRDYQNSDMVYGEKIKVMHILINLYKNAKEAFEGAPKDNRKIVITTKCDGTDVSLSFKDTGVGVKQGDLDKFFTKGFTTKRDGHGFGLHSSMNYIEDMGGSMYAKSDGPGKGTEITVSLPLKSKT